MWRQHNYAILHANIITTFLSNIYSLLRYRDIFSDSTFLTTLAAHYRVIVCCAHGMVHNQLVRNNHPTEAEVSTSLAILFGSGF